jgi:hypothetical protein
LSNGLQVVKRETCARGACTTGTSLLGLAHLTHVLMRSPNRLRTLLGSARCRQSHRPLAYPALWTRVAALSRHSCSLAMVALLSSQLGRLQLQLGFLELAL